MDFVTWARSPWGEDVLTHISWSLFWASLVGGVLFFVAHGGYMLFSRHQKRPANEVDRLEAERKGLPAKVTRHTFVARTFHWVDWHWMAGIVLTGSIIFHIVHASFFLDFWSIWVGPKDIPEMKRELLREFGKLPEAPTGKYPLGNRLYHLVVTIAGLAVIATGLVMMVRIRNPIIGRNPYVMSDPAWGVTYVLHGLAGVGFVGLIIAHIYFALRPEKLWITKSMIFGYITRRQYLEHHDPDRWKVTPPAAGGQPTRQHVG
jgi:formate dehydrogenase subunit gamma